MNTDLIKQDYFLGDIVDGKIVVQVEYTDEGDDIWIWTTSVVGKRTVTKQSFLKDKNHKIAA